MIVANCGNNQKDGRPQLVLGLNPEDLLRLVTEGSINLNEGEPEDRPLPAHVLFMWGESNKDLEERLQQAEKLSMAASEGDEDGNAADE